MNNLRRFRTLRLLMCALTLVCSGAAFGMSPAFASPTTERMPNFVGMSRATALRVLRSDRLYFTTKGSGAGTTAWQSVVGEVPTAGTDISTYSTVTLDVSLAAPLHHVNVAPVTTTRLMKLVGQNESYVDWYVRQHHLHLIVLTISSFHGRWNDVLAQNPGRGAIVRSGNNLIVAVAHVKVPPAHQLFIPGAIPPASSVPPKDQKLGMATWYHYVAGRCATWYLPHGTRLYIKDLRNGHETTCLVTDTEGSHGNRAVDLDSAQFSQLAPLSSGVIPVRVWW